MDKDKILKINRNQFIPTLIFIIFVIIFSILAIFLNSLFLIAVLVSALWFILFLILNITNIIISHNFLKRYDIDEVKHELYSKDVIKLRGKNTYLTKNYIVSNDTAVRIVKYNDIVWVYNTKIGNGIRGNASIHPGVSRYSIEAYLKNRKRVTVINKVMNYFSIKDEFEEKIKQNSKETLIGYNIENVAKYKEINKKYKILSEISDFSVIAIFLIIIVVFIIYMFF